jgi:hypothetical protein
MSNYHNSILKNLYKAKEVVDEDEVNAAEVDKVFKPNLVKKKGKENPKHLHLLLKKKGYY